jgi:RimJ/RimL family protein N-acetyltransferase
MSTPTSDVNERSIETERLVMRPHLLADFDASAALWGDPEVTRFIGGRPFTREEVWTRHLRAAGHWAMLGFGYWTVRRKSDMAYVGEVGFADFKRDIVPAFHGVPEMGWVLNPAFHGQGLAGEAVAAGVAWGDAAFGGARTVCIINPDNAPSIRLAQKHGFVQQAATQYHGAPTLLFERVKPG